MDRHERQARFPPLGRDGQDALARARVAVVGCGALGSVAADLLARAGVGALRLLDRDVVELGNLHRLALFDEADVEAGLPKAVAAARHLSAVSSQAVLDARVEDLDGGNARALLDGCDLVVDGTDNFEARHVLNEAALESGRPWVHAACLGSLAVAWALVPGQGACYACAVPDAPGPGEVPTCETEGVIGPAVHVAASLAVAEAMKLLAGRSDALAPGPFSLDVWTGETARVRAVRDPDCPACGAGRRRFLGRPREGDVVACGRGGVQLLPPAGAAPPSLEALAGRLGAGAPVRRNAWLVRFPAGEGEITVFRDGRILVSGTRDVARARSLVAQYLGG